MRWAAKRDLNEMQIFNALIDAHCGPVRGRDSDVYATHRSGHGVMLEIKSKYGTLRPIQVELQAIFRDRYRVVRTVDEALEACGVKA